MVTNCSTWKDNIMLSTDLKGTNFYLVSRLGFKCLDILDVSVATRGSLRRVEWLGTAQHAKLTQCYQLV